MPKTNDVTEKKSLDYDTCWFCKQRPPVDEAAHKIQMYTDVSKETHLVFGGTQTVTRWRKITVNVPRCSKCKSFHIRFALLIGLGVFIGLFGGMILAAGWESPDVSPWVKLVASLGVVVVLVGTAYFINWLTWPKGSKLTFIAKNYPGVKIMKEQGWKIGRPA